MRRFRFNLRLREGRIVTAEVVAEQWQWSKAFAEACARVEERLDLGQWSGLVCVSYESSPVAAITSLPEPDQNQSLPAVA